MDVVVLFVNLLLDLSGKKLFFCIRSSDSHEMQAFKLGKDWGCGGLIGFPEGT